LSLQNPNGRRLQIFPLDFLGCAEDSIAFGKINVGPSGGKSARLDSDCLEDTASPQLLQGSGVVKLKCGLVVVRLDTPNVMWSGRVERGHQRSEGRETVFLRTAALSMLMIEAMNGF
jgi:hypothetical protein